MAYIKMYERRSFDVEEARFMKTWFFQIYFFPVRTKGGTNSTQSVKSNHDKAINKLNLKGPLCTEGALGNFPVRRRPYQKLINYVTCLHKQSHAGVHADLAQIEGPNCTGRDEKPNLCDKMYISRCIAGQIFETKWWSLDNKLTDML